MNAQAWSALSDPRQGVRVALARVRVGALSHRDAQPLALAWQQRMEDALRCASLGEGQRLVLIRKLQVRTGSASAPGWAEVVQAAAQDAVSRACHGRSAGANRADAVWFESWDDAVGAWLDAALGVGSPELSKHAWYWPRIARRAGLPADPLGAASGGASAGFGAPSVRGEQARAMWARWQADPISQRACRVWIAQRPGVLSCLTGRPDAPVVDALHAAPVPGLAGDEAHSQGPEHLRWARNDTAMPQASAPEPKDQQVKPEAAFTQTALAVPDGTDGLDGTARSDSPTSTSTSTQPVASSSSTAGGPEAQALPQALVHVDRLHASSDEMLPRSERADTPLPTRQAAQSSPSLPRVAEASSPTLRSLGWTHLRFTQLGGVPFTIRALQGLGFAHALSERVSTQARIDERIAASAPWLYLWARLSPHARQQWVRDPMFSVLPAFEWVADLAPQDHAPALLACWQAQPLPVRSLGQQAWRGLHRALRHKGWRSAIELLQRPAWMQLSSTHLDVLFTLDQADLNVRRLGLDADPGWVPWLGRIVSLHFEPAGDLPAMPAALRSWSTP